MEVNIKFLNFYNDGKIEIVVQCNNCKKINYHNITNSSTKTADKLTIDFLKLGTRCCDNHGEFNKPETMCNANYKLYQ
jgi:hypothetical protein